jgi:hypothetical protein
VSSLEVLAIIGALLILLPIWSSQPCPACRTHRCGWGFTGPLRRCSCRFC